MTYKDLLESTATKKKTALKSLNEALKGPFGPYIRDDIKRNQGSVAWLFLAKDFCETLAAHVEEFIEQTGDINSIEAREIGDIFAAYENSDRRLYELLPVEAQLFTR